VEETAETPPSGLAQAIYNAVSVLQYEGQITFTEAECSGSVLVGNVLNLTGGLTAWTTMAAQVQRIVEDIDRGQTEIGLGVAAHLGGRDLLELIRAFRNWAPSTSRNERITAQPETTANVEGSVPHGADGGYNAAPDLPTAKLVVGSKNLTVAPKDVSSAGTIPSNLTGKWRPITVCDSGTTKTVLVLCTESF